MIMLLLAIASLLLLTAAYFMVIKPYFAIKKLKKDFEANGYTVLMEPLNFFEDMINLTVREDQIKHKDGMYRFNMLYKNYDVLIKNCFFQPYICINSADLLKQVFQKIQFLVQPEFIRKNLQRLYGGGLLMTQGKQWRSKRKMYSQIFNFHLLEQLHPVIQKTIQKIVDSWEVDQDINILQKNRQLFFNVFVAAYFGRQFDNFSYKDQNYQKSLVKTFEDLINQSLSLRNVLFGEKFLQKAYFQEDKHIQDRLQALKIQTKSFMIKRFEQISQNEPQEKRNILSKLVFSEQFKNLSSEQKNKMIQGITGDVFVFFFAGTDTTSATLTATLHILHKNPSIRQKLIQQIKQSECDDHLKFMKNLKYMDAVFKQTLRLYGPANFIFPRTLPNDNTYIGGVKLPKQTLIGIQSQSIHCSEKYYKDPMDFNPQRWFDQKHDNPYCLMPFGGGSRNCIGQHFAKIEYKLALYKILTKFNFSTKNEFFLQAPLIYVTKYNNFVLQKKD